MKYNDKAPHLQIELSGCKYSPDLDAAIADALPDDIPLSIHGEKAPAAGPELLVEFFLTRAATPILDYSICKLLDAVIGSITSQLGHEPHLCKVGHKTPSLEILVIDFSFQ